MRRIVWPFVVVLMLTLVAAALSHALVDKGYGIGAVGLERLAAIAGPLAFMPLAGLYALAAGLVVLLPIRAAAWIHDNASTPIVYSGIVLLATIVGLAGARTIFAERDAYLALLDWRYLFAAAVIAVHMAANRLRSNVLIRSLAALALTAAALACLYWSFRV